MRLLSIPIYSTPGNHDMGENGPELWHELFGRVNVHFIFKGTAFTLVDSSRASIEPDVYDWLKSWADDDKSRSHLFFTHYPPVDPIGIRGGSFSSRNEAYKLLAILQENRIDSTFHGHVHSFYSYDYSGMPAYISGGGGAFPEKFDNVGRHYLKVTAGAAAGLISVKVAEVD